MKILHALVGYLAATALPFPSHPFAFASPRAAISNYDGYVPVNTTLNSDGAVMKRGPGDIIETRQAAIIIPAALFVFNLIVAVVASIFWVEDDDPKRAAFTQNSINKVVVAYPNWNWVICHSPYAAAFDGVEGTDWGYTHHELGISFHRTIGYDLYWAKSGTFFRYGDGGFINWAYNGKVVGTDDGGATVHFGAKF